MPATFDPITGTLTFVGGTDDDQAGIRMRVDGDAEDRVVLLFDGQVLIGNGTDPAEAAVSDAGDAEALAAAEAAQALIDAAAAVTVPVAITGGESPTETEFNDLRQAVADIVAALTAE